jgi:hypothetical protein
MPAGTRPRRPLMPRVARILCQADDVTRCATCVSIERIRRDRVLHEALTRRADPLYLARVSSLSLHLTQPLTG